MERYGVWSTKKGCEERRGGADVGGDGVALGAYGYELYEGEYGRAMAD